MRCAPVLTVVSVLVSTVASLSEGRPAAKDKGTSLSLTDPDATSILGVRTWKAPSWHFPATGTHLVGCLLKGPWSHVSSYGGMLYIAGQRGYSPETKQLVPTDVAPGPNNTLPGYTRIYAAYQNMLNLAAAAGATPQDCVRTVIYTTDMFRFRPTANAVTIALWGSGADIVYPVRTIIEVSRLNEDDIIEVEGTFAIPQ